MSNDGTAERGFMSKVWLITGASRGLGRAFTQAVLDAGDRVIATARKPEQLVGLKGRYSERVRTVALDVTNEAQAKAAFEGAITSFGGRFGLRFIGHIQRDSTNSLGISALKPDKLLWLAGCRDHAISCVKHRLCERTAEATRSTGNEPHL